MMDLLADWAEQVTMGADDTVVADPDGDAVCEPEDNGPQPLSKFRFTWREADAHALTRIEQVVEGFVRQDLFGKALAVGDAFYEQMRVRAIDPHTGQVLSSADGRPIWKIDPNTGEPEEHIEQLTGQDYDYAILTLQRILLKVTPEVNQLARHAMYAQHLVARDAYDEGWIGEPPKLPQNDKRAKANIAAQQDRYHSYFRYCLYSSAKTYLDELNKLVKRLENIRYRQFASQ